jgi:hypothetical protein
VEVWRMPGQCEGLQILYADLPVICKNFPVKRRPFAIVLPSSLALKPRLLAAPDALVPQRSSPQTRARIANESQKVAQTKRRSLQNM